MKRTTKSHCPALAFLLAFALPLAALANGPRVEVANGILEGTLDKASGVRSFKGIPFAAPPVGELRWKAPQPAEDWEGVRAAREFGPRPMQPSIYSDMVFRSPRMSEDSLYLNVWAPADVGKKKLPVLLYFYGGGFTAGDSSEPRYDGASMAERGIVTVTANYRLGVFGFMAHPKLTAESPNKASGNYGLLDQVAALKWVHRNIAVFGGDPERITIAGESAGSMSVSALMASPLSRGLIAGAIGESGSLIGAPLPAIPLSEAEKKGEALVAGLGLGEDPSLADLRKVPAETLLQAASHGGGVNFTPIVDGYFMPTAPADIYAEGQQAQVPLLAGVNSAEMPHGVILGDAAPTVENYRAALKRLYPKHAEDIFTLYPATNPTEVMDSARELASDRFISYGTWKWAELAAATSEQPVYYYLFSRPRPAMLGADQTGGVANGEKADRQPEARGAGHSVEIEYALGNLDLNKVYAWTPDDYTVSRTMQSYFANFIKTGNPNGQELPKWPRLEAGKRMVINVESGVEKTDILQKRYKFLDQFYLN